MVGLYAHKVGVEGEADRYQTENKVYVLEVPHRGEPIRTRTYERPQYVQCMDDEIGITTGIFRLAKHFGADLACMIHHLAHHLYEVITRILETPTSIFRLSRQRVKGNCVFFDKLLKPGRRRQLDRISSSHSP